MLDGNGNGLLDSRAYVVRQQSTIVWTVQVACDRRSCVIATRRSALQNTLNSVIKGEVLAGVIRVGGLGS